MFVVLSLLACTGPLCVRHADCEADEYCDAVCEPVRERAWEITVIEATTDWEAPEGGPWDEDYSPPDLYVDFGVLGGEGCFTTVAWDDTEPFWGQVCRFYVPPRGSLVLDLWDVDTAEDVYVTGWTWEGDDLVDQARRDNSELMLTDGSGTIALWASLHPV